MTQGASSTAGTGHRRAVRPRLVDPGSLDRPWLASYPPGVPPTYHYPRVGLERFLDDAARDFPELPAIHWRGVEMSYAQLRTDSERFAAALVDHGVRPGQTVGVLLDNLPAAPIAMFGAWRAGAVVVGVDPHLDQQVIQHRLAATATVVAVTSSGLARMLEQASLPHLHTVVLSEADDWRQARWWQRRRRKVRSADPGTVALSELLTGPPPSPGPAPAPDSLAAIQFTTGTGGRPRAVALTHFNLVANSFQARLWVPDIHAGSERLLAAVPVTHPYGLTLGMLTGVLSAATLVLLDGTAPDDLLTVISAQRPTLFPATPELYRALSEHRHLASRDLTSLRACVSGGAALPPEVAARFEAATGGARVREGYGCAEASPLTHANPVYGRGHNGSIGLPVSDTVAAVVDPEDPARLCEPGTVGELAVHGPQVSPGYWQGPDAGLSPFDGSGRAVLHDGWLLTGDLASMGHDGEFRLAGRRADDAHRRCAGGGAAAGSHP